MPPVSFNDKLEDFQKSLTVTSLCIAMMATRYFVTNEHMVLLTLYIVQVLMYVTPAHASTAGPASNQEPTLTRVSVMGLPACVVNKVSRIHSSVNG